MELFGVRKFHGWTRIRAFFLSYSAHWGMKGIEYSHLLAVPLSTMLIETPVIRLSIFFLIQESTDSRTRSSHNRKFRHLPSNSTHYLHSFFQSTVLEWNRLPQACIDADTLPAFKVAQHAVPWTAAQNAPPPPPPSKWYSQEDFLLRFQIPDKVPLTVLWYETGLPWESMKTTSM